MFKFELIISRIFPKKKIIDRRVGIDGHGLTGILNGIPTSIHNFQDHFNIYYFSCSYYQLVIIILHINLILNL